MITYLKNMEGWKHKDFKSKDFDSIKELFDKDFKRVNMFVDYRTDLVEGSSKRERDELEQEVTKKQKVDDVQETAKVDDDQETAKIKELLEIVPDEEQVANDAIPLATKLTNPFLPVIAPKALDRIDLKLCGNWMQHMHIHVLVEKRYPLTPATIIDMLNKKLQADHFSEMAYQLLKLLTKQLRINEVFGSILLLLMLLEYYYTVLIDVNAAQSKLVLLENFNEDYSKYLRLLCKVTTAEGVNAASEEVSTAELVMLDLEKEKDAQAMEILVLKKRVKRLERQRNSGTSQPRRRKYRQVESSADDLNKEDASKEGRSSDKTEPMLLEKKYPLIKELFEKMLNLQLEAEEESTMAFKLIKFIKSMLEA
ncbi:hypothetical protein Tco_0682420 [Tanacetum coccineum]|uniref:Uncharacterized protein n=1 Tax=Tanacetum coccineum TaxID=301880 RepID=A0ABQ4XSP6_9ASTR